MYFEILTQIRDILYKDNGFANAKGMFSTQMTYTIKLKQIN